jgi:hypothetical protein
MTFASIYILFIRSNRYDDELRITPCAGIDQYAIYINQPTLNSRVHLTVPSSHLIDYIHMFMKTLSYDTDKPESIQVDCPGFPSVLLRQTELILPHFVEVLSNNIKFLESVNWPRDENTSHARKNSK